ncbi:MAG: peptide chain release factor 1 [Micavibrio sp.]|nr:peptide chain release factor 1 [Micavibrio sp.]|tara:strand:+ start:183916 stop:184983 length:1068 start_codon:yes stop_codon:yes gene_type:complete
MSLDEKLTTIISRHEELAALMAGGDLSGEEFTKYSMEYAELDEVVGAAKKFKDTKAELEDLEGMLSDPEMKDLAQDEMYRLKDEIPKLENALKLALIPKDADDTKNIILEIRAGTGGDEAALFVGDLFSMYKGFASSQNWQVEVIEYSESDVGGFKEIIAGIRGKDVFGSLKFESGVHRVQRVPETESGGRIHTSAATVAVLPEAEEADIKIDEKDLRIDVYRASGSGGQHVNKTESAVRITHIPTGTVVAIQDESSQHKNKAKAMKILQSRIYDEERRRLAEERSADRKSQVGSGDRSERIRTYNYPQGRVTDHRINLTLYKLDEILAGSALIEVIEPLRAEDQAASLAELETA